VFCLVAATVTSGGCKPWTSRPIHEHAEGTTAQPGKLDATSYVAGTWDSRVLPEAASHAQPLEPRTVPVRPEGRAAVFVRGAGTVMTVDTRSRVGLAVIDLDPSDDHPDVVLQIGPVIRGTAVRDALSFISFSDFASQIEFAEVASALNAHVLTSVVAGIDLGTLERRRIVFTGATSAAPAAGGLLEVVPVSVKVHTP
jgi:predicted lipoprotein